MLSTYFLINKKVPLFRVALFTSLNKPIILVLVAHFSHGTPSFSNGANSDRVSTDIIQLSQLSGVHWFDLTGIVDTISQQNNDLAFSF